MVQTTQSQQSSLQSDSLSTTSTDYLHTLKPDEFLPAISRWTSLGGAIIVGAVGVAIALATVTQYHVAVKANGSVRPAGELNLVQAEIEGTVERINVTENQTVKRGDAIATLDESKLLIQQSQHQGSLQQNQLQLAQLDAQTRFVDIQILAESQTAERAIAVTQAEASRNQRTYEEQTLTTQADFQEAAVVLEKAEDERNRYQQLANDGAISVIQFKEKEVAVQTAQIKLERARASLNPSRASVTVSQQQTAQEQARGQSSRANLQKEREALIQRRSEVQSQVIQNQKELEQVQRELEKTVIRASSDGVIFKLNLQNENQFVRAGDSIAQIAPSNASLIVKASVANQDIEQVAVGQSVQMRINACSYTDYGTLSGIVKAIAPDTGKGDASSSSSSQTTDTNNRSFEVTIQPINSSFGTAQRQCQLQAGMEASTSIIAQEETVLQFFLRKARLVVDL